MEQNPSKKTVLKTVRVQRVIFSVFVALALSAAFTSCDKNTDDNNNGNGNGNGNGTEKEWVEIGGVKWATCNVDKPGTFTAKPEEKGMFYQWNRKIGWSNTDPITNSNGGTTWDSSIPSGNSWEKANNPCPTGWRVPTLEEQQSLINSGSEWTTLNGVTGRYFGTGDQRVFFPVTQLRYGDNGKLGAGSYGYYWSSKSASDDSEEAYGMNFSSGATPTNSYDRTTGVCVRCVKE